MTDIINFATAAEIIKMIEAGEATVSGMTVQEAIAALNATSAGGKAMTYNVIETGGGQIIQLTGQTASAAFEAYETAGGTISTAGAASEGAAATANLQVIQGTGGATGISAILSTSLPVWTAAVAPLLGVAVGVDLYESNPTLWTKISQTLLPFCYEDTEIIPWSAVWDATLQKWGIYAEGDAIQALKDLFDEEGIGPGTTSVIPSDNVFSLPSIDFNNSSNFFWSNNNAANTFYAQYYSGFTSLFCNNSRFLLASNSDTIKRGFDGSSVSRDDAISNAYNKLTDLSCPSYTYQNKTVYYFTSNYNGANIEYSSSFCNGDVSRDYGKYAWLMVYGGYSPAGEFPEGTSAWDGDTVDYTQTSPIQVPVDTQGNLTPYYPVTIPVGDPGVSNNPLEVPDPTAPVESPVIEPYINPTVSPQEYPSVGDIPTPDESSRTAPLENPVPQPSPGSDPDVDPSQQPQSEPNPQPEPPNSTPPSGGLSPDIIFPVDTSTFPSIIPSSSASGLIHVYNPTSAQMIGFGRWLWVTYADATIDKIWNNPFDGVISAHEIYCTPVEGYSEAIRSGFLTADVSAPVVAQRYQQINCGSIVIPEYYANYLDYSPYTKAHIYLPFIGIVELDCDDIIGHGVNVTYTIDTYNGACIAQITVAKSDYSNTVYQFSGNCAVDLPLAGGSQASIKAGMISAAAYGIGSTVNGIINGAAYGGGLGAILGGVTGAVGGISSGIANAVSQKSSVQHSGSFGASYGAMGIKKPFIIVRRPIQKKVMNYNIDYGFPAHKRVNIGNCSGYLRVREVHVVSATANDAEKALIEQLLKTGVYVTE